MGDLPGLLAGFLRERAGARPVVGAVLGGHDVWEATQRATARHHMHLGAVAPSSFLQHVPAFHEALMAALDLEAGLSTCRAEAPSHFLVVVDERRVPPAFLSTLQAAAGPEPSSTLLVLA